MTTKNIWPFPFNLNNFRTIREMRKNAARSAFEKYGPKSKEYKKGYKEWQAARSRYIRCMLRDNRRPC